MTPTPGPHSVGNRTVWNRIADEYQRTVADLGETADLTWGWWRHPETELRVLGDLAGLHVLDLGCGAATGTLKLARLGARAVGLDGSSRQLEHARRRVAEADVNVPLVHGDAEELPFADARFDLVVSMWGAFSFCDPHRALPEAARVLRPAGALVVCTWSPIFWLCTDAQTENPEAFLLRDYFNLEPWTGPRGAVRFQLPYGGWIHLFRDNGLCVERLIEPPAKASTPIPKHFDREKWQSWITRWPFDCIWVARKVN